MIRIHHEGRSMLSGLLIGLGIFTFSTSQFIPEATWMAVGFSVIALVAVGQFFRNPVRTIEKKDDSTVFSPCDGKVVVIEEVEETEYFKDRRIQVSIFMSPLNVHVNRNPISGTVKFFKYHPGKYLVAWHPKSSTENERTTTVIKNGRGEILFRQIAGAVARRIRWYIKEGQKVEQGDDMGFIKFGSRVDVFLPLSAKIEVKIDQVVKGNLDAIARF